MSECPTHLAENPCPWCRALERHNEKLPGASTAAEAGEPPVLVVDPSKLSDPPALSAEQLKALMAEGDAAHKEFLERTKGMEQHDPMSGNPKTVVPGWYTGSHADYELGENYAAERPNATWAEVTEYIRKVRAKRLEPQYGELDGEKEDSRSAAAEALEKRLQETYGTVKPDDE